MTTHQSSPFRGLRAPAAPAALRTRTLAAARAAARPETRDWVERVWQSTGLRLAWAAACTLLVVANLMPGPWPRAPRDGAAAAVAAANFGDPFLDRLAHTTAGSSASTAAKRAARAAANLAALSDPN